MVSSKAARARFSASVVGRGVGRNERLEVVPSRRPRGGAVEVEVEGAEGDDGLSFSLL